MNTFGFKGNILPILDKNNRLYVFVKNENTKITLLNIVSSFINTFVYINNTSSQLVDIGEYKDNLQFKIFCMGREVFDFTTSQTDKNLLLLYSNFLLKNHFVFNKISFSTSFINGVTIKTTSSTVQQLYVKIVDKTTGVLIEENVFSSDQLYKLKKEYFINYDVFVYNTNGQKIYTCQLDLFRKKVYISLDSNALGDTIAWIPYIEEFRKKHNCEVFCNTFWNNIFKNQYPKIKFVSESVLFTESFYAAYTIKCQIPPDPKKSPVDYRECSLQTICAKTLGVDDTEIRPMVYVENPISVINEPYVVIATQSTTKAKLWNNPTGWQDTINYLIKCGFKVVLLQKERVDDNVFKNVINLSGESDIYKSINIIHNCKFFIGLSSGLSWLAWALNKKVIMISGFSLEKSEFKTNNYRVINKSVCHGCWCDKNHTFEKNNWFWCPKRKNFECTTSISSNLVIENINKLLTTI